MTKSKIVNSFLLAVIVPLLALSVSYSDGKSVIPDWIKNNAKWWSSNQISDSDFTKGIEYMIKENIIVIPNLPPTTTSGQTVIPHWLKNNAGWWANGQISQDDFVNGIKWLVEHGIIKVNPVGIKEEGVK